MMERILLAADGSEAGERALAFAIELAKDTGAALEIISVRPLPVSSRRDASSSAPEVETPEQIASVAVEKARFCGIEANAHAAHGDVVACVTHAALALHAELLVVGSRGLGAASGAKLGSVSQALVRRSPIPVTVVQSAPIAARV